MILWRFLRFVSDFLECCGDFSGGYWGYEMQRVRFLRAQIGAAVVLLGVGGVKTMTGLVGVSLVRRMRG